MTDMQSAHPEWWKEAFEATDASRVPPVVHGAFPIDFPGMDRSMPSLGVATLPGGYLLGMQGWAFTPKKQCLVDASWYGSDLSVGQLPRAFGRPRELSGTCLSLASDFAGDNYGHYLLDSLSRLELFKRTGGRLDAVDHVFIAKPPSRSARRTLEAMGIPIEKCVWADRGDWIRAEQLVVISFPGLKRNYPAWLPASLQQYFLEVPRSSSRVYVPRTGVRKAVNEAELTDVAKTFGFEIYDFEACAGEPEFFASVDAVIGAHGAAMANLAYCKPGTRVLELIPTDHVYPYFYTLAESAKLDYHALAGKSLGSRPTGSFGPSPFDFFVDPQEFRATLIEMGL